MASSDLEKNDGPEAKEIEEGHLTDEVVNTTLTSSALERKLLWRQDKHIVPLAAGIYFCYLDRSNIGYAKVLNSAQHNDMQFETGTSNYQFNIALMIFLIGYFFFEIPSNVLLKKLRPSRWLAFLMFSCGVITIGMGGVHNFAQMTGVQFMLGAFEVGLVPGLIYYLTFWYKSDERSLRVAFILASATLASAFGGAIAYGVGHMNRTRDLSAWRWLFILEGIPSCLSGILVWFFLPDYPERASWLSETEKDLAAQRLYLEGAKSSASSLTWDDVKATLTDWRLYGHYAIYFAVSLPFSSLSLFSPSIVAGLGFHDLEAQLMTVPPWAAAYGDSPKPDTGSLDTNKAVFQILMSWSADHFNARGYHCAIASLIGAAGFLASAVLPPDAYTHRYGCLIVGTAGAFGCIPPMLGWLTSNMWSTASIGLAVALNVSIGAGLGQIPGVWIYKAEEASRGYPTGHGVNCAMLFFVAFGSLALRYYYGRKNRTLLDAASGGIAPRLYKL
ncbi:MFS general substrate transporter [Daldinia sp. FL1419]|nr:MFS general substrate transporter [Daldinia sp. FL1419]